MIQCTSVKDAAKERPVAGNETATIFSYAVIRAYLDQAWIVVAPSASG